MADQQQRHTNQLRVEVDGSPLADEIAQLLVSGVVDDDLNLPDLFSLSFRDGAREVIERGRFQIGAKVRLSVVSDDAPGGDPLLSGEVTALEVEHDPGGTLTIVRGYDQSHRLFRGQRSESYANVTYADVAVQVARRAGLQPGRIDATTPVHQHVSQGNQTDWQFLRGLAAEVGYEVAVVQGKLDFRRPARSAEAPGSGDLASENPLQLSLGSNLLRLRAIVTAAEQVREVEVRGWDVASKRALIGSAPAATSSASLPVEPAELAGKFNGDRHVGVEVPYRSQAEVDAAATALAERVAGAFAELEGTARGNPKLRAGKPVSLGLVGEPFDGKYTPSSTRHVFDPEGGYTTAFTVSGRQQRSLRSLVAGESGGPAPGLPGVVVAQVTDVRDPEQMGRVKLRFPWLSDDYVSDWARTSQPGAGSRRGAVVLPEVNDEVLVAFEWGDLRRPYVVGGLWNGVDPAPLGDRLVDASTGAVRRRGFVSKLGHCLVFFDDDADSGVAVLSADRGLRIALDASGTTIHVASSGKVEIEAATDVTVKAGGNLKLEASASLELKGAQVSISADGPVQLKGNPIQLN
jgi:phage protein D/phage baseplate assembly protein gpV